MSNRILSLIVGLLAVVLSLGADWKPDRRPIGLIFTGPVPGGWSPDKIEKEGARQIKERWEERIMWHMPASWEPGHMSGAQWFTLTRDQRSAFRKLNKLCNDLGKKFYVYGGIAMESAMSVAFTVQPPHCNDFYDGADHYEMWELVIEPWRRDSCDGWLFDAGAHPPFQKSALAWCKWLREEHGMWCAIEAFPLTGCPKCTIDEKVALAVPCVARYDFNPSISMLEAPAGSEMHVWTVAIPSPAGTPENPVWITTMTPVQVADLLKRGFIVDPDEPHDEIVLAGYKLAGMTP